ncbi:S-phase kinase-associated protein 2 [Pelodytes ibericus]
MKRTENTVKEGEEVEQLLLMSIILLISHRRHLQEIPASSRNVPNFNLFWDSSKSSDLLSGMGVSPMEKDPEDTENTPQARIIKMTPPLKRQKPKERDDDVFVIARRPRVIKVPPKAVSCEALPDELFLSIFSYLNLTDLLRVSRVCKRWNRLSSDDSLWYSLDLCGKYLSDGVLGKLLSYGVVVFRCPRSTTGEPMFKDVGSLRLQHVDLSNCTISVTALQSILSRCYKLQNLTLEGLELSDDIMRSLAQNVDLVRLNLCGCSGFSPESLHEMLRNCTRLRELNLSWCDFTEDHIKSAVSQFPSSITELNLSGYRQNVGLSDVGSMVTRCPDLTNLDLSDSVQLDTDCFHVLKQLPNLKHLSLSRCYQISATTLLEFGKSMPLKTLSVYGIVTDSSLLLLQESLPHTKINGSFFSTIARPTTGLKKNQEIWGMKCNLTLTHPNSS